MKRFRFRLRSLLWLVALAAAVLWGIRYRQDQEAAPKIFIYRGGKTIVHELPPDFMADGTFEVYRSKKPSQGRGERVDQGVVK